MKTFKSTEISGILKISINNLICEYGNMSIDGIHDKEIVPYYAAYARWHTLYLLFEEEAVELGYAELNDIFSSINDSLLHNTFDQIEFSKKCSRIDVIIKDLNKETTDKTEKVVENEVRISTTFVPYTYL